MKNKEYYSYEYDNFERFISYQKQIELINKLNKYEILNIGIGTNFLKNYYKNKDKIIYNCDIDKDLKPDYVGDIKNIKIDKKFDIVCAFQILEHLEFKDFEKCIINIHNLSKEYVLISLPYGCIESDFVLKGFIIKRIFNKDKIRININIPLFWKKFIPNIHHKWELGYKNYSIKKIKQILNKNFDIIRTEKPILNNYHYFFILRKK